MASLWLFVISWLCHRSVHAAATPCSSSQSSHRCGGAAVHGGEHARWQPGGHLSEAHSWRGILGEAFILRAVSVGRVLSEESGSGSATEGSVNMPTVPPSPLSTSSPSPPLPPPPLPPPSPGPLCLTRSCQVAVWGAATVWLILGGVATLLVMRHRVKPKHATSCSERRITPITRASETEITVCQLAEVQVDCPPFEQLEKEERCMELCTFTNLADLANLSPCPGTA